MRILRLGCSVLATLGLVLLVAGLSRVPYDATTRSIPLTRGFTGEDAASAAGASAVGARIRLSWRMASETVEECRRLTSAELERLPIHMRREEVCEGRLVPYRLEVALGDSVVVEEVVQPSGARGDRPLYVYRELNVPPGEYDVAMRWERVEPIDRRRGRDIDREPHMSEGERQGRRGDSPRAGAREQDRGIEADGIRARLDLGPRDIALITYDPDRRRFVARGRGIVATRPIDDPAPELDGQQQDGSDERIPDPTAGDTIRGR